MNVRSALSVAITSLGRNKLRSALTILGITIGIAAVICTVAIGEGGSKQIEAQLQNLGDNMVWVEAGGRNVNGVRTGNAANKSLTVEDAEAIRYSVPLIKGVSPNVDGRIQVVYGNQNWFTHYRGDSPDFLDIRRWKVASGVMFTDKEVQSHADVCLLGQTVIGQLFNRESPVGKTVRVGSLPCVVIGTLESKGITGYGDDQDDFILLPYTTVQRKIKGIDWLDDIFCSAISPNGVLRAQKQIAGLLRQRHHLRVDEPDDFNIRHPEDALQAQEQASRTFTLMLAAIASVSLLVGGIGIMNIMLVSVTERTREIGVRLAVGATEEDVRGQFLIEAVVLSLIGGGIGILFGVFASIGFSTMLSWPISVSYPAISIAIAFSVGIGIFFGYYPARKAALLSPIDALRYE